MAKWSNIIAEQTKPKENPNLFDIKSVTIEHTKTKSPKRAFQVHAGKNSNSPLYSETTKSALFLKRKMEK